MTRIGFVGLGKLGLPCAVAMAMRGADVMGYDIDPGRMSKEPQPYREAGPNGTGDFNDHLMASSIRFGSLDEVVRHAELLFVAVQTPHDPRFEGITSLTDDRADFDYGHLIAAAHEINSTAIRLEKRPIVVVISTVLPGTIRREVLPALLTSECPVVYNPFFIAMGTTMRDFLKPEFVLLGADDVEAREQVARFYSRLYEGLDLPSWRGLNKCPSIAEMAIESAELTKVAYNTFIGQKIVFANTIMEICAKLEGPADCDEVIDALSLATERVISPAYLRGGMGDGGGCHPRDNIAMSWLARRLTLSHDLFDDIMRCREDQAAMMARILAGAAPPGKRAIVGYAYKPGTDLIVGSSAQLVRQFVDDEANGRQRDREVYMFDHHVQGKSIAAVQDGILASGCEAFLIGCKHPEHVDLRFPSGSVVIDPFRYMPDGDGWWVIRLGEAKK